MSIDKISPRNLSDDELVRYYSMALDEGKPVPLNWQVELLRRFLKYLGG